MSSDSEQPAAEGEKAVDEWKCLRCGEEFTHTVGYKATVCPNPNCGERGIPVALTGRWVYFVGEQFVPKLLADDIMRKYHFITREDSGEIYVYDDEVYRSLGEERVRKEAQARLGPLTKTHHVNEVVEYVRRATYTPKEKFEAPVNLINVANGILHLDTMTLEPHTPDKIFINKLPVAYDPAATCPRIEKFTQEVFDSKYIPVAYEVIGYCLYRAYPFAKAVALIGDGENGKSTWFNMVREFLGRENCAHVALQDLDTNRFAAAGLHGKLANIYADLSPRALSATGKFKMLTGGDRLDVEHKFIDAFSFENYAKLLFSCNRLPVTTDESSAFWRRWIILNFPRRFPPGEADPKMLEKITTPAELSGLLNLALEGLKRLLEKGQFTYAKTPEEIRVDYIHKSDPVWAFIEDELEPDPEGELPKADVYRAYVKYCNARGLPTVQDSSFVKGLLKHMTLVPTRPTVDGARVRSWKGVKFKQAPAEEKKQPQIEDFDPG